MLKWGLIKSTSLRCGVRARQHTRNSLGHYERVRRVVSYAQDADLLLAKRLQEQEHAFAMLAGCAPRH